MPLKPQDAGAILVMGAGTVGSRVADLLLSVGYRVKLCKYDARKKADGTYEIKTAELRDIYARYPNVEIEMYAARGSDLKDRIDRLSEAGFNCKGSADDIDFSDVALAIDASNGMERRNIQEIYLPNGLRYALNGGADATLVDHLFWASFPGTPCADNLAQYVRDNCLITSCNTHCVTTALGLLGETMGPELFRERIRDISVTFCRRHEDPHKGARRPEYTSAKVKPYHMNELEFLVPEAKGLINTVVSKWPIEYFHTLIMDLDFHGPVSDRTREKYLTVLEAYPRCIVALDEVSHEKTVNAGDWAGIGDGDLPFPVYLLTRVSNYKLKLLALTPQRGIVGPSVLDYVLLRTNVAVSWREAFAYTNTKAFYRGKSFGHIKNSIQYNLEPRFYKEMLAKHASVAQAPA